MENGTILLNQILNKLFLDSYIALANKLLRQAFAVGTSLKEFDNNLKINLVD